jgi:hypothetical protein
LVRKLEVIVPGRERMQSPAAFCIAFAISPIFIVAPNLYSCCFVERPSLLTVRTHLSEYSHAAETINNVRFSGIANQNFLIVMKRKVRSDD